MFVLLFHRELKGVIVTLNDSGRLECAYLGTDPALFIPPPTESRDLNYADMDREMAQLQKAIKENQHKAGKNGNFHSWLFLYIWSVNISKLSVCRLGQ